MWYRFFETVPGLTAWGALLGLVLLSWKLPTVVVIFIVLYDLLWFLKTIYLFFHLRFSFVELRRNIRTDWLARLKGEKAGQWERFYHLVIFPMYREGYDVVRESFESLCAANYPSEKMIVVLATEEAGGEEDGAVAARIAEEYGSRFAHFLVTRHPTGVPGELRGKGSNEAFAARAAKRDVIDAHGIPYEDVVVSVFDIDTRTGREYFALLTHRYLSVPHPEHSSFQPIPLFTNNVYRVSVFARLTGFSATFWQLMQQGRPEQLVTFSSHSMPFKALVEVGYWQKDIVSEDSRIFFQCLMRYKGDWNVVPLHYPIYMDAVSGKGFWEAMASLYKQQRRWAWGAENFAFLMEEFRTRKDIPGAVKRFWSWRTFDGFFSWSTSSFIIFLFGWLPNLLGGDAFHTTLFSYNLPVVTGWLINLASIGIVTSAFLSILLLPPERPADVKQWRVPLYLLQWFLMPATFIVFGSIPALDAQTRLMLGGKFRLGFWKTPKQAEVRASA